MNALTFELIRDESRLVDLGADWNSLYESSRPRNPFLSHSWVVACWHNLCDGAELHVLTARSEGRLVGIAPLRCDRELGFRVLRFIGNGWSDYQGFLVDPDMPEVESELLTELERRRCEWDLAVLRQLSNDYTGLVDELKAPGLGTATCEGEISPYFTFPGDWQQLYANGPGWLKRHAKYLRRFERDGGTYVRLTGSEAAARMDEVVRVEAHSWKLSAGVARMQPGPGERLMREALETVGEMELWLAHLEGQPAGFQISFVTESRIWIYQCAFDERFPKSSVGGILAYLSIERAWNLGVREYDYLSGDEAYKAGRTDRSRALTYRALYPQAARGYAAYGLLLAPRWRLKQVGAVRSLWQAARQFGRGKQVTASVTAPRQP